MKLPYKRTKQSLFLEYFNEWLTVEKMAEYYGKSEKFMNKVINQGRTEHEKQFS